MNNHTREKALLAIVNHTGYPTAPPATVGKITAQYACDVFTLEAMQKLLSPESFSLFLRTVRNRTPLPPKIAEDVASAMRQWAIARGATHYTHWFQPLTGSTAEKHDALFEPDSSHHLIVKFSGKNLIVSESDASSFPSGGLRSTFEARGYTAWDPTSPAFLRRAGNTVVLCIPTAFCSWNGESLDQKTPLLRSIQALSKSVHRLMRAFHADQPDATVSISLGVEQEYFLVDRHFYFARPDLIQAGRTLFGAPPPKHQQLEDHYFGAIRPRILAFMSDVERQLWRLGIPAKTRHNEVAPAQFELAPIYEDINLAVDHNMLIMEILRQTAEHHGLICLLHEKPFAGVNGSGKHNNWSLSYNGVNLLDPGNAPRQNAIFLTVLCAIIRAIDLHGALLRASITSLGNDLRLGAHEAPPPILSVFLGKPLTDILSQIETGAVRKTRNTTTLSIGVDVLPPLPKETTDRNRTSPFAFTVNKFEFRAPGASQSCAATNTVLNTIIADSLDHLSDQISRFPTSGNFHAQLQSLLRRIIRKHKRIIFNGNGYDASWRQEAARRRLPNPTNALDTLQILAAPATATLFERHHVLSAPELRSRHEVFLSEYLRKLRIEGELSLLLSNTIILPAALRQLCALAPCLPPAPPPIASPTAKTLAQRLNRLIDDVSAKSAALQQALAGSDPTLVLAAMARLRRSVDDLERTVADDDWPLPKYREILFIY